MRVLIACECSGTVRDAFTARGHRAMSCDIQPSDTPGLHFQGDATLIFEGWEPVTFSSDCDEDGICPKCLTDFGDCPCFGPTQDELEYQEIEGQMFARPIDSPKWDLMIAHPPCTHLATSGAKWFEEKRKDGRQQEGIDLFMKFANAPIDRMCIENPVGIMGRIWRSPDQVIQPYYFGDEAQKTTCLWLKNIPTLSHCGSDDFFMQKTHVGKGEFVTTASGKVLPKWYSNSNAKARSKTFQGIADAMADQWG